MTRISRRSFISTSTTMAASPVFSIMDTPHTPKKLQHVVRETPYWMEASGTPGMAVALLEGGRTKHTLCFGSTDLEGKVPVTESTIFQAASLSKQALLYAVLKTVEAGKLDLDRPLSQYLDKPYPVDDPDIAHITTHHVLTHTTGWPNWPDEGKPIKRLHPPGEKWGYSGAGFVFLQTAVESIWNEPATQYTQRLVLDPLGMHESSFVWRDEYTKSATMGYDSVSRKGGGEHPTEVNGASSLHTSAREYALLLEAYLGQDMRDRHPGVYQQQVAINSRLGWSHGWGTAGDALWQWGDNGVFKAFAALVPARKLGIVILTNSDRGMRINREWVNAWLGTDFPAFYFNRVQL